MPTPRNDLEAYFPQAAELLISLREIYSIIFGGMIQMAAEIGQRAVEKRASIAYGQYLKERGVGSVLAQSLGSLSISIGARRASESRRLTAVVGAIRFFAQGHHRQRRAIQSRAAVLIAAWDETSIIDEVFKKAGLNESEFVNLLKALFEGRAVDRDRIREIAAAVAPSLPNARGRKVSAASAAHERYLETVEKIVGPAAYTWSEYERDYTDEHTKATRQEFGEPNFNPRSAYERFSARRKAKTS